MLILSGADVVLADRIVRPGSVVIDHERIVDMVAGRLAGAPGDAVVDLHDHLLVPGFVDVHVHGLYGTDTLDGPSAVSTIAAALPRHGVTAFSPTTVACPPAALRQALDAVREARERPAAGAARVLPAHLESNFISPAYRGAQPLECLRMPPARRPMTAAAGGASRGSAGSAARRQAADLAEPAFSAADILGEIERAAPDVGIVTLAPELEGALDLIAFLRATGCRVSLGHSGASYDQARSAIAAGATEATHLFNRMPPIGHREPGLAGAVLERPELIAEIICDGHHVHPAMIAMTVAAKGRSATMAITDSLAGAGLPVGSRVSFGGRAVTVRAAGAYLDDGTLAGSVQTMDGAFRVLTSMVGLGVVDAVHLCSSTPAREMGLSGFGVIAPGAVADLVALDRQLAVRSTWIAGSLAFPGQ